MEVVSVKFKEDVLKNIDDSIKKHNFNSRTEFIREAVRDKLSKLEKDTAIRKLAEFKGKFKSRSRISDEEAGEMAFKRIAAKHGIKLD